jgi:hypothetical protein
VVRWLRVHVQAGVRERELREKRKWSQEELAPGWACPIVHGAIERGEKDLRLTTLVKLEYI